MNCTWHVYYLVPTNSKPQKFARIKWKLLIAGLRNPTPWTYGRIPEYVHLRFDDVRYPYLMRIDRERRHVWTESLFTRALTEFTSSCLLLLAINRPEAGMMMLSRRRPSHDRGKKDPCIMSLFKNQLSKSESYIISDQSMLTLSWNWHWRSTWQVHLVLIKSR